MNVADLLGALDDEIGMSRAAPWDHVGLQIGSPQGEVGEVGVCHEVSNEVIAAALQRGIATIVSYHPLLFSPTTTFIDDASPEGRAFRLAAAGLSLIVVHTAFDATPGGAADALASTLGVDVQTSFGCEDDTGTRCIGRAGNVAPMTLAELRDIVASQLATHVHIAGNEATIVSSIAVVPGSGGSFIRAAAALAEVLVTGDLKHHDVVHAQDLGLSILDAGHVPTERPGVDALYDVLRTMTDTVHQIDIDPHQWKD
jgi:dinuclear metal center YbgI/SA1388 family protein